MTFNSWCQKNHYKLPYIILFLHKRKAFYKPKLRIIQKNTSKPHQIMEREKLMDFFGSLFNTSGKNYKSSSVSSKFPFLSSNTF